MGIIHPRTPAELAEVLAAAAKDGHSVELGGAFSKRLMAGPVTPSDVTVSTACMRAVLQYEPQDLTVSVEAGLPWHEFAALLARHRQTVPLDPPFSASATVGGVVAANTSGPRRRLYGTARDAVIGMKFITLEGKTVQSGGMVVKNVAGLDMAKLMIGSFGTLAAIAVVNFKLTPIPEDSRTFIKRFASLDDALAARDAVLGSVLQPAAIDLLNPRAAARVGLAGWCLLLEAGGSSAVLERWARELPGYESCSGTAEADLWGTLREFTPRWLAEFPRGGVLRVSSTLAGIAAAMAAPGGPAIARAGNGVTYQYLENIADLEDTTAGTLEGKAVVEFAPAGFRESAALWPSPGPDFEMMLKIKALFDPRHLLNKGRLYGRI